MKRFACNMATFFGCQPSSCNPICVVIERERRGGEGRGDGRGRESVHLDLLSSVAVVGQGWPSLGDAHYQFFGKVSVVSSRVCLLSLWSSVE